MTGVTVLEFEKSEERGFAIVEAVTFLMVFIIFTLYVIDLFSAIHTGIVNSIAARTYLFETLQHRTDIGWFRQENSNGARKELHYTLEHERFHSVTDEDNGLDNTIRAPARVLTQVNSDDIISKVQNSGLDSNKNQTTSIRIKSGYGICLDAQCPQEPQ